MAASLCVMQAAVSYSCGSPVGGRRTLPKQLLGPNCTQRAAQLVKFRVRGMAADQESGGGIDNSKNVQEKSGTIPEPTPTPPPPPKVSSSSSSFFDVLAFSGPGPERINGRLAMIGFAAAMGMEIAKGQGLFSQIENGGVVWFVGTSVVLSLASLIPLFKGVSVESKSGSVMSSDAELWNGRFAMLGLVALAFTEYLTGAALV